MSFEFHRAIKIIPLNELSSIEMKLVYTILNIRVLNTWTENHHWTGLIVPPSKPVPKNFKMATYIDKGCIF